MKSAHCSPLSMPGHFILYTLAPPEIPPPHFLPVFAQATPSALSGFPASPEGRLGYVNLPHFLLNSSYGTYASLLYLSAWYKFNCEAGAVFDP